MATKPINKSCRTCKCPTDSALKKEDCPGYNGKFISPVSSCPKWNPMPERLTVTEAHQYAFFVNVVRSRPTIISMCKKNKAAKLINGTRYTIDAEKFREILEGVE